uniref:Transketolase, chloroplastic n=1 Tax=Tanacetum cinerariifolium TaxID=118510 RepID=A0A6L2P4P9_TANCI|nr:transketolase, chloroplastic [Tanacetum cinerariifolium]
MLNVGQRYTKFSQKCLNNLANVLPRLLEGSANFTSSNMTLLRMYGDFQKTLLQNVWELPATRLLTTQND